MDDNEGKIKIKRSDGRIQYVTRLELDQLNADRKKRDQNRASSGSNPINIMLVLVAFAITLTVFVLWFSP